MIVGDDIYIKKGHKINNTKLKDISASNEIILT